MSSMPPICKEREVVPETWRRWRLLWYWLVVSERGTETAILRAHDNLFIVLVTIRSGDPQNTTAMVTRSWLWRRIDDMALSRARIESLWVNDGEEMECRVWCGGKWWETEGQVDGQIRLQPV